MQKNMLLGEILVRQHLISSEQLNRILKKQKKTKKQLGKLLLDLKIISQNELETALQEQYWRKNGYWVIID